MTTSSPQTLIQEHRELVSLPVIVTRLNEMINDPACSAADIAETLSQDAALSARLLKIVNSPFYGFPSRIDTISMAVTIVGTRQLRDLTMATLVVNKFNRLPEELVTPQHFWRHNIAVACAARTLAERLQITHTERLFITGLLHDIGKLVMYLTRPETSARLLTRSREENQDLGSLERDEFGFDHAELGAELLRQWHLPESLIEPVARHHQPALATQYQREAAIIHLANAIGNTIESILTPDDDLPIDTRVWQMLDLSPDELADLTAESDLTLKHALQVMFTELAA